MLVNTGGRARYRVLKNIIAILEINVDKCVCVCVVGGVGVEPL
jgi:hypothetical protein